MLNIYIQIVSSRDLGSKLFNTLTRKIPNGRILRQIIIVGIPREYISIVYRRKEINQVLANK